MAFVFGNYILDPIRHKFPASEQFKEDLVEVGLEFQPNNLHATLLKSTVMKNGTNSEIVFQMKSSPLTMVLNILAFPSAISPPDDNSK